MLPKEEVVLRGLPISKGIGIGFPFFFIGLEEGPSSETVVQKEIELEVERYRRALDLSRKDLEHLHRRSLDEGPPEVASILSTHLEMMEDPLITKEVEEKIRETQQNTEQIFRILVEEYKQRFSAMSDPYFRERVRDVVDVSRRILGHLRFPGRTKLSEIPHNSVILTSELVPSETIEANASLVSAFVTSGGGVTSHAAIIARAKGIPYVANIDVRELQKMQLHSLIVDGSEGIVIMNPSRQTLKKYQELKHCYLQQQRKPESFRKEKAETIDGYEVRLFANLENPKEISLLHRYGAAGVGLFRSEYLFFEKGDFPSEEEQFQIYRRMVRSLRGRPLVVRIFDVGGDKKVPWASNTSAAQYFLPLEREPNPALGCRAIRFLLRYPEVLRAQLSAILRAARFGEIHILIPMVSDIGEIRKVRDLMAEIREEGKKRERKVMPMPPLGCMVEVPSSAIMCDAIAKEADFISIGTNDLAQYVLAADRNNPDLSSPYLSVHPSLLRLIRMVVLSAEEARKPVILCGELAADPLMVPILIGLGIREFSVASRHIPQVKETIRKWRIVEACRLAEGALESSSAKELKEFLAETNPAPNASRA